MGVLRIKVPGLELYDSEKEIFIDVPDKELVLEHSLLSVSKWEAKWKVPFLADEPKKTEEQTLDYIKCMTINLPVDDSVYASLLAHPDLVQRVSEYIDDPMTASSSVGRRNGQKITSELIYSWMVSYQIPWECEKWHLNRLMMLIRICAQHNRKPRKIPRKTQMSQQRALNEARRAQYGTSG